MCLYNTLIKNRKYVKNKKNGGVIPTVTDRRIEWIPIGCGNCIECRKQKAREWQVRLMEDIKTNTNGKFITLTFSNESIAELVEHKIKRTNKEGVIEQIQIKNLKGYERDNQVATKAIRLFNERWRKQFKTAIRHWLVTELGHKGTENIHLHGIIWTNEHIDIIRELWKYGYIWPRKESKIKTWVNAQTVNYIVKYISKIDQRNKEYKSIVLTSPGIGKNFIQTKEAEKISNQLIETYRTSTGHKIRLPIYWRNKLFSEYDKETLWIQKLDKEERWVCGEKIDISKDEKNYLNILQFHRQRNAELGYGGKPNQNRKEYEEQRREIMIMTRIANARNGRPPSPQEMG